MSSRTVWIQRVSLAALGVVIGSGLWAARGQDGPPSPRTGAAPKAGALPWSEGLDRTIELPFREPTTLSRIAAHLEKTIGSPVVLDAGAIKRRGLTEDTAVAVALDQARVKTALRLLLSPLELTYRLEREDNLLIITDAEGAEDISNRILETVRELHRDVHDVQDAVGRIEDALAPIEEGPEMRRPTIIEPLPEKKPVEDEEKERTRKG